MSTAWGVVPASAAFGWPTLPVNVPMLVATVAQMVAEQVQYHLGAKAPRLSCQPSEIDAIDCSGLVRYALYRASGVTLPDGSVNQHDWCDAQGFKHSNVDAGKITDGALRIAFLSPAAGGGVGHVSLIHMGRTLESHGGMGPDRRPWTGLGWQGKCSVYVLTPPDGK
jgi:cell wall-associated NlpC family hydrolase